MEDGVNRSKKGRKRGGNSEIPWLGIASFTTAQLALVVTGGWVLYTSALNQFESRFNQFERSFTSQLGSLGSRLDSMDSRLDSMDSRLNSMENRITSIEFQVGDLRERVTRIEVILTEPRQAADDLEP